ncbi:MAG TPA: LysR substrate-binding domain-containing protein [Streptosporangiaceae bacterium]|jgi:DNA-binding transcriptional LysR family regulator
MELRQLEYFVTVVAEQNFTRAAERLHVAQPGISAQIRQLERELGQPLLDRSGRTTTLTETGKAVLPFARAALDAVAGAREAVNELAGLLRGHVAVGMVVQCAALDLPALLAAFHHRYPGIDITLAEDNSDRLADGVRDGSYDLAFIGTSVTDPPGLSLQVVADEPVVAAFSPAATGLADLAGRDWVALAEVADRTVISLPPGTGLRSAVDAAYSSAGLRPHIAFEASDPRMLARLAEHGLGLAFLPASVAAAHGDGLHVLSVRDPEIRGRLALAWRAEGAVSPAARALIAHARATLAHDQPRDDEFAPSVSFHR